MSILNLRQAMNQAATVFGKKNNLQFIPASLQRIYVVNTQILSSLITTTTLRSPFIQKKVITNKTNQPTSEFITFEQDIQNIIFSKTINGYKLGVQESKLEQVEVLFSRFQVSIPIVFRYNVSNETEYIISNIIHWSDGISVFVPPKTKTTIYYIINVGDFAQDIEFQMTVGGTLLFNYPNMPDKKVTVHLTDKGAGDESIGDILKRLYSLNLTAYNSQLNMIGSIRLRGTLGINSLFIIQNNPLGQIPLPTKTQTIPSKTSTNNLFL
ncbi:ETX/MTX2 family pore-forming toxin [Virgibacillus dokdonensis]|nr:ETX/MTX2 family pore-forming toxin [Virgibacillus dokdonensis]